MTTSDAKKTPEPQALSGFGLWYACPEGAPVGWGARAIADNGCGFSIVHDRQTFNGPMELRKAFSRVLNQGPLKRAVEEAKRLRDGWTPCRDLSDKAFEEYWRKRLREEPELFESFSASSGGYMPDSPGYPHFDAPKDANPLKILYACRREQEAVEAAEEEFARMEREGEEFPIPDPPSACENDYDGLYDADDEEAPDPCEQKFKKVKGEWQGCYQQEDAWVCDECGHWHSFDDDAFDDEPWSAPNTPIQKGYRRIVGPQGQKMRNDKSELFTLYDDDFVIVKGNTNGSYGYVYLIAYPKHDVIDIDKVKRGGPPFDENTRPLAAPEDVYWSGPFPVPMPGDTVNITRPAEIGESVVIAHRVEHNILLLITAPEGPLPDWRDKDRLFPTSDTWNVTGNEISEEVKRAEEQ